MKEWFRKNLQHKKETLRLKNLLDVAKKHGPALVVIIVLWEVIEDVLFPALFFLLGMHVNPAFLGLIPVSWLLCLHWLAVPAMWWVWIKLSGKKKQLPDEHIKICDHDH